MNRIYRKVWNKSLGVWAVASELASGDSPGAVASAAFIDRRQSLALAAAIALALGGAGLATPLPANAQSVEVGRGAAAPGPPAPPPPPPTPGLIKKSQPTPPLKRGGIGAGGW
ncbi:ESPR domain-containing protein [Xanthomonas euvesicatoria pv. eucalypti]|nr:ESPR domain-containing protein [Xanthomonas euvesicatoria]MDO7959515.1 ESPR domain-containing protein [Xanthomonas euvesicatoria pv. eucalypti]